MISEWRIEGYSTLEAITGLEDDGLISETVIAFI